MKIVSRAEWGARPQRDWPVAVSPSTRFGLTVHHNGPEMRIDLSKSFEQIVEQEKRLLLGVQNWHMDHQRWNDIAYSFAVGQSGTLYEGRGLWWPQFANGADQVGVDNGPDSRWFTVLWMGGGVEKPTLAAYVTLDDLVEWLRSQGAGMRVIPHNDIRRKSCPGPELTTWSRLINDRPLITPPSKEEDLVDLWLYINGCYDEAGRAPHEDRPGRRYWYKDFLTNSGESRVERMRLMEQLLGLS